MCSIEYHTLHCASVTGDRAVFIALILYYPVNIKYYKEKENIYPSALRVCLSVCG